MTNRAHKKRIAAGIAIGMLAIPATAGANVANSIQPSHVYFGKVTSGQHPVKIVSLRNRSGHTWKLSKFVIAGSGGGIFTVVKLDGTTCAVGETLKTGESCQLAIRVHGLRSGWFRSVLRACYTQDGQTSSAFFGSAELRVHLVPAPSTVNRTHQNGQGTGI